MAPSATPVPPRAAAAVTTVLTCPPLLKLVTSFSHGIPAALYQLVRDFDAQAPDRIGMPYTRPDYSKMTVDRLMHLAQAVGHAGDVGAVSILLATCPDAGADLGIACLALAARSNYKPAILKWLLDHQADDLAVNFGSWAALLLIHGETRLLSRVQERIGIDGVLFDLPVGLYDSIGRRGVTDSLRWLHERGVRPSFSQARRAMLPLAIVRGHRSLVEFYLETSQFQLCMLGPSWIAEVLNTIKPCVEADRRMAHTLEWALDKGLRFNTDVVVALVRRGFFLSARRLIQFRAPPPSTVLLDV